MIAFDSPAGAELRAMGLSRAALAALWFEALTADQDIWAAWAHDQCDARFPDAPVVMALYFLSACKAGDVQKARQLWQVLGSLPLERVECPIIGNAQGIGQAMLADT